MNATSDTEPRLRAAVIGAGPAGFYSAELLLDGGFAVDVFDRLPTPFGLVRSGVAPDHPRIKSVTRVYEATAKRAGFRYFGGVDVGRDVQPNELRSRYHAVVYGRDDRGPQARRPRGEPAWLPFSQRFCRLVQRPSRLRAGTAP